MKSSAIWIGGLAILVCLAVRCLASHHGFSKSQSIDAKEQYSHKNGFSRDKKLDYHRYQDWDEDWSNEDMMQHPIDEAPRKVAFMADSISV